MIAPTLTALAAIIALGHHAPQSLQMSLQTSQTAVAEVPAETLPEERVPRAEILPDTPVVETSEAQLSLEETPTPEPTVELIEEREEQPVEAVEPVVLTEAEKASILQQARQALADAQTAQGRFVQQNSDGTVMSGDFALRRPGRVRFDYDAPTPILIVADGATVAMEDSELETVDRIPLASTPLGLILDDDLDFAGEVEVLRINRNENAVWITVQDATGEVEGELSLIFDPVTYGLLGWLALDAGLQMTTVSLEGVETNGRIDPRLFRLDEAEDEEDER